MTTRLDIRPARADDLVRLGDAPRQSFRGYVVADDEHILGAVGVIYAGGQVVAVSKMIDEMHRHPKDIVRVTRKFVGMIGGSGLRPLAVAENERAAKFLEHIGFEHIGAAGGKEHYQWHGQRQQR